jgi:hypothetical protein
VIAERMCRMQERGRCFLPSRFFLAKCIDDMIESSLSLLHECPALVKEGKATRTTRTLPTQCLFPFPLARAHSHKHMVAVILLHQTRPPFHSLFIHRVLFRPHIHPSQN